MNNAKKIAQEIDKVTEGFARVPTVALPPKIRWGEEFQKWPDAKKIQYLTKFAEAMNHAAATIQDERDALGRLAEQKEAQILQMKAMLENSNRMLEAEITKMNEYRQEVSKHAAKLTARIRELEQN